MMFRRLQKQLHDTELGTGSGTTGTRTCTYVQVQWGYSGIKRSYTLKVTGKNQGSNNLPLLLQALSDEIEWPSYPYYKVAGHHQKTGHYRKKLRQLK
jgi:hypothetical protein